VDQLENQSFHLFASYSIPKESDKKKNLVPHAKHDAIIVLSLQKQK
jgi:hypothetical protein